MSRRRLGLVDHWLPVLEWTGAAGGLAGALLMALRLSWSGWAFVVFLVFTAVLLVAAAVRRSWPHVALFAGYTVVNVLGVYRWLVAA